MSEESENPQVALIAEQLRHTLDLLEAQIDTLRQSQVHIRELTDHRLARLEAQAQDTEQRLRNVTEGVTQFKVFASLASGSSGFMSLVALLRSFLGG